MLSINDITRSRKLYLDDERPTPQGWDRAYTAPGAIAMLAADVATGHYGEISLDHDLGPPSAGTGYDVLLWLEERVHLDPGYIPPAINIHSANPAGRERMLRAVKSILRTVQARAHGE